MYFISDDNRVCRIFKITHLFRVFIISLCILLCMQDPAYCAEDAHASKKEEKIMSPRSVSLKSKTLYSYEEIAGIVVDFNLQHNDNLNPDAHTLSKHVGKNNSDLENDLVFLAHSEPKSAAKVQRNDNVGSTTPDKTQDKTQNKRFIRTNFATSYRNAEDAEYIIKVVMMLNAIGIERWVNSSDRRFLCISHDFKNKALGNGICRKGHCGDEDIGETRDGFTPTKAKVILKKSKYYWMNNVTNKNADMNQYMKKFDKMANVKSLNGEPFHSYQDRSKSANISFANQVVGNTKKGNSNEIISKGDAIQKAVLANDNSDTAKENTDLAMMKDYLPVRNDSSQNWNIPFYVLTSYPSYNACAR